MGSQATDGLLGYMKAAFKVEKRRGNLYFYHSWKRQLVMS
jgi:hypothetical protein